MIQLPFAAVAIAVLGTLTLSLVGLNDVNGSQWAAACLLLFIPCASHLNWRKHGTSRAPLFAMVAFLHWMYFAFPLFLGTRRVQTHRAFTVDEESVTEVMWLAVAGMAAMWAGMRAAWVPWRPSRFPDLDPAYNRQFIYIVLFAGTLLGVSPRLEYLLGGSLRNLMFILANVVPMTAFAILGGEYMAGRASQGDKAVLLLTTGLRSIITLASGWASGLVFFGVVCTTIYISARRRLPWALIAIGIPVMLFLQVGKESFRKAYWYGQAEGDAVERLSYWVGESYRKWADAFERQSEGGATELAAKAFTRVSLLEQAANVVEKTPDYVGYQKGRTYSYFLFTFIPRFVWPDKPSISEANQFYQVAYGLTRERDLDRVSIAVGYLVEGYINFGWLGVIAACGLVGFLLGLFALTFLSPESGVLWTALGLALVAPLLSIEWQAAQYLSGVVQQILLTGLVFYPATAMRAAAVNAFAEEEPPLREDFAG